MFDHVENLVEEFCIMYEAFVYVQYIFIYMSLHNYVWNVSSNVGYMYIIHYHFYKSDYYKLYKL